MIAWILLGLVYICGAFIVWLGFFAYSMDEDSKWVKALVVALWPVFAVCMMIVGAR